MKTSGAASTPSRNAVAVSRAALAAAATSVGGGIPAAAAARRTAIARRGGATASCARQGCWARRAAYPQPAAAPREMTTCLR